MVYSVNHVENILMMNYLNKEDQDIHVIVMNVIKKKIVMAVISKHTELFQPDEIEVLCNICGKTLYQIPLSTYQNNPEFYDYIICRQCVDK